MCSSTKGEKFNAFSNEIRIIIDQYFAPNDNPSQNNILLGRFRSQTK